MANSLKHVSFQELFYNLITKASNYTYRLQIYLQSVLSRFRSAHQTIEASTYIGRPTIRTIEISLYIYNSDC